MVSITGRAGSQIHCDVYFIIFIALNETKLEQKWNEHIRNSRQRNWTESKAHSSWQIFKIMAEFVDGFEALAKLGPCISIFGSARTQPGHAYYELTVDVARKLSEEGFGIISGGGPGIMEAANKGAQL